MTPERLQDTDFWTLKTFGEAVAHLKVKCLPGEGHGPDNLPPRKADMAEFKRLTQPMFDRLRHRYDTQTALNLLHEAWKNLPEHRVEEAA